MKKFMLLLIVIFIVPLLILFYRSWRVENSSYQKTFLTGTFPFPSPSGFYKGSIQALTTKWEGKIFDASSSSGINVVEERKILPFKTYKSKGLTDKNLDVLILDYNLPQNPFWVRAVVDELVQNAPGRYTGKVYLKLIPGFPFSVVFFKLEK